MTPDERKMLDDLAAGLPALVRDLRDTMQKAQGIQQKLAAHASMLQAYGYPIPKVEGLQIQMGPVPNEVHEVMLKAVRQGGDAQFVVPPAPAAQPAPLPASGGTVRELVKEVLKDNSKGMTVHEIRKELRNRHNAAFATSSIYRILMQECSNDGGGRWRLKK